MDKTNNYNDDNNNTSNNEYNNKNTQNNNSKDRIEMKRKQILAAVGEKPADTVIRNVSMLNVFTGEFELADVAMSGGVFVGMTEPQGNDSGNLYQGITQIDGSGKYLVPGLIDGHMHLESSAVQPAEYAQAVIPHGTTAIVADPHEITNVCGMAGLDYVLDATSVLDLDVFVMLPSCVPATPFDENFTDFSAEQMEKYYSNDRVLGLAEVMNYPGVIGGDEQVLEKIDLAEKHKRKLDGHAPGLSGKQLNAYNTAGIYTDHECTNMTEAKEKLRNGEWIMVREGTASKNLNGLIEMFDAPFYHRGLLVTDDKHPGSLIKRGHIDDIIRKAIALGARPENAFTMGSLHAAQCFGLERRGAIAPGYIADFILLDDVKNVKINQVYKQGRCVHDCDKPELSAVERHVDIPEEVLKSVHIQPVKPADLAVKNGKAKIIGLVAGELLTTDEGETDVVDVTKDIIKLCVIERHNATGHIGTAFIKGYGLKNGAIGTTIAHDSHNIIVAGANDEDIACAVKRLEEMQGGMVIVRDGEVLGELACPIAGLMTTLPAEQAQERMDGLKRLAGTLGVSRDIDPFMTLSFTSLPVIPKLKLTTLGVVDVERFCIVE